ncbi:unnamed protein product [Ambrosiozyma monospora]|uniref:Unnamed protein product n=1 Tax=Ambrosiozyma monospora TaxID=43982 RepID=A0A9W6YU03_AMBMO|nr:unnamed protein product [Ambrosiozyma monospora]
MDNDDDKIKKVTEALEPKAKTPAVKKPSLVRKKRLVGRKKRLVPTLLGTTVVADLQFTTDLRQDNKNAAAKQSTELTKADLETNIRLMVDRLCVWDAIGGVSPKDDDSSYVFLTSCVVPYYQKVHMKLLKELVNKVKGPSMSRKEKEERKKKKIEELKKRKKKARELELAEAKFDSRMNSGNGKTTSFFDKPRLQLSPMKVRRTASSLISQKQTDLSKKTFQMVSTASLSQLQSFNGADSQDQTGNSRASHSRSSHTSTANNGHIFTQRRVRKLGVAKQQQQQQPQAHHRYLHAHNQNPPKLNRTSSTSSVFSSSRHKSEVEVEATPMKLTSRNNKRKRDETPLRIDESPAKLLVSATPSKLQERQRRREVTLVSATPASKKQKKHSFVDNIHSDILSGDDNGKSQDDDSEAIPPTSPIFQTPVKQLGPSPIMMTETPIIANLSDDDEGEEEDDDDFLAKMPPSSPVLRVTRTKSSNVSRRLFDF